MGRKKDNKKDNYWDEEFEKDQAELEEGEEKIVESKKEAPVKQVKSKKEEEEDVEDVEEKAPAKESKQPAKKAAKAPVKVDTSSDAPSTSNETKAKEKSEEKGDKSKKDAPAKGKKKGGISKKMAEAIIKLKEEEEKKRKEEEERAIKEEEEFKRQEEEDRIMNEEKEKKKLISKEKKKEKDKIKAEQEKIKKAEEARARFAAQGVIMPDLSVKSTGNKGFVAKPHKKKKVVQAVVETKVEEVKVEDKSVEGKQEEEEIDSWETRDSWEDDFDDAKKEIKKKEEEKEKEEERLKKELEEKKAEQSKKALSKTQKSEEEEELRSPICCVLGHVDTGKTKLLDNLRHSHVQEGEAGGITQQIGATYFPLDALKLRTASLMNNHTNLDVKVPGLLLIDTPGHESFTNLRSRGSSLCDIAILVVDIMHGMEQQTIESLNLLKAKKIPFIVALNKIDRIYGWKTNVNTPIQETLAKQDKSVQLDFENKLKESVTLFAEQSMNAIPYYKNKDFRKYVSIVPVSAVTGEGIPDILMLLVQLTQRLMADKLLFLTHLQCTVLEVKVVEGLGTTIDVILVNGTLNRGDTIVVCGLNGPIVTNIRALLTPQPLKEIRIKGSYVQHEHIKAAMGIKISAGELDKAIAGSSLLVCGPNDDLEHLKKEVMVDLNSILKRITTTDKGVYVQSSTLGSLEALLEFLSTSKIPVSGINIGPVNRKDVVKASVMLERAKEFAVILAFDVKVSREAKEAAEDMGVKIFEAEIIYHLKDAFDRYMQEHNDKIKTENEGEAVFPCKMKIIPEYIFNTKNPIVVGVEVLDGVVKINTPIVVPTKEFAYLGRITSIERDHKAVTEARKGQQVAIKMENSDMEAQQKVYGRHFDFQDELVSKISRQSIDVLKMSFKDELKQDDLKLIVQLKKTFGIQ